MGEWIIIQPVIKKAIKKACKEFLQSKRLDSRPSVPNMLHALELYWEDNINIEALPLDIRRNYDDAENPPLTLDLLKCAFKEVPENGSHKEKDGKPVGVNIKVPGKTPLLLELLSYFYSNNIHNWAETLKNFGLSAETYFRGEEKEDNKIDKSVSPPIQTQVQNTFVTTHVTGFSKSQMQIIDSNFWKAYKLPGDKKALLSSYFTHADSSLVKEVIANDEMVPPNDFVLVSDSDGNVEERTIIETIKSSDRYGIFLLKIILEGGVGKTTFLYWIAKHFQHSYNFILISYLGSLDIRKILLQAKSLKKQNGLPVSLLIDNISDSSVSKQFERIVKEIKFEPELSDTLFIIAERESRYRNEFINSNIELLFGSNILSIVKVDINKETLFEKIYDHLITDNPNLKEQSIKEQTKDEFLKSDIPSISESIHYLIKSLKLKNIIRYVFDWEDWTSNKFEKQELANLYAIVACFYQFGIRVSTSISTKNIGYASEIDIVNAINRFGGSHCPIQLTEDGRFLSLKHEHLANWFFDDPDNRTLGLTFFMTFLTEINTKANAKLLRKIRKVFKRDEFKNSILAKEFDLPLYIDIIKTYVELPGTSSEEKAKMLMEEGIAYNLLGNEINAINSFNAVLLIDKDSNHAKDQLARIYLNSPETYGLAFSKYYEIYKNNGAYALKHMYFIIQKSKEEGVKLNLENVYTFSNSEILDIVKLFITERNLEEAIELLRNIPEEKYNYEIAAQFNLIAHYLPFADHTIKQKEEFFLKAIQIKSRLETLQKEIQFDVDYGVFLYRITRFTKSTEYLKSLKRYYTEEQFTSIADLYFSKVRGITKFFFRDIPNKENITYFKSFLYKKCKKAAQIINRKEQNIENVIRGITILHTVRYHSRVILPEVFNDATIQLGYAYTYHAEKPINNLSSLEIRSIAENYFNMALEMGANFTFGDSLDMIRNLQNYKTSEKTLESLSLINFFLESKPINRICPGFFRMKGNAHCFLGNFDLAIKNYHKTENLIPKFRYKQEKDSLNDRAFLYNNFSSLICDMYENKVRIKGYDLNLALKYSTMALEFNPVFEFGLLTKNRVEKLLANGE